MNDKENSKSWAKNNGRTISATTDSENGNMTTTEWPRNATNKDELNDDQIEVIKKAVTYPSIDNIAALNRRCEYETYHADTYAYQVLEQHWPERLESHFNEEEISMTTELTENNDAEIGGISISSNETTDADEIITENNSDNTDETEWPAEVTQRKKLNDDQIKVITAAINNPDVESTGKLTEKAGVTDSHNRYYAYDVLEAHWPQMLDAILNDEESTNNNQQNTDTDTLEKSNNETDNSETKSENENKDTDKISTETTPPELKTDSDTKTHTSTTPDQPHSTQNTPNNRSDSTVLKILGGFIAGVIVTYRLLKSNEEE